MDFLHFFLLPFIQPSLLSLKSTLVDFILNANTLTSSLMTSVAQAVLRFDTTDATIAATMMTYITAPVGFVIMLISFLTSFLNRWKNGNEPSIDDIARPVFFLIIADVIMCNIGTVVGGLMSLSNMGGDIVQTAIEAIPEATREDFAEEGIDLENMSLIQLFLHSFFTIIGLLAGFIAAAMLYVVVLTTKVELMVRFIFAPIGLASIADESKKDDTFRYFKKLVASAFYLIGIQLCLYYANMVGVSLAMGSAPTIDNAFLKAAFNFENSVMQAALPFAAIGIVSAAKNVVNESFGS